MNLAVFGIENNGLNLFVNLLIFFLIVIWLALVYWTYSDARRRIDDPMLVGCATVAALFPFIGPLIYTIVRPPEFLDDAQERELEIKAAQSRLRQLERQLCPNCNYAVEPSFLRCPSCMFKLKDPCGSCGKPVDPSWRACPFCETPLAAAQKSRRTSRTEPKRGKREKKDDRRKPRKARVDQTKTRDHSIDRPNEPATGELRAKGDIDAKDKSLRTKKQRNETAGEHTQRENRES